MLSCETLRENVQELREAAARLDQELIKAGDLPPELLAEILLLVLRQKLTDAAEEVKLKGAPLFAAANRAGGAAAARTGRGGAAPAVENGRGQQRRRK
jgi:hypothetical protein